MYKLFLDDVRNPKDVKWINLPLGPWVIVRNYHDFVKYITSNGLPEFVAFDHDLGQEHYIAGKPKYDEYKEKVFKNPDAMKVKLADLRHNTDIRRLKGVSEKDIERMAKYNRFYLEIMARLKAL